MKSFYWILGIIVIFVGFVSLAIFFKNQSTAVEGPLPGLEATSTDYVLGNGPNVLMEYADFQCPACRAYYPVVKQLLEEKGDKVTFIYRYFPLAQHLNAYPSAQAAEAAGKQGKFFEMEDKLFTNQDEWASQSASAAFETFKKYATDLGLDMSKFEEDYKAPETKTTIKTGYQSGLKLNVNQTPTFFLNGKKLDPAPQSYEQFVSLIEGSSSSSTSAPIDLNNTQL